MKKWICPSCSESHEINFEVCWNCQYLFNGNESLIDVPQKKENIIKKKPSLYFISTKIGAFICAFFLCILLMYFAFIIDLGSSNNLLFFLFVLIPSFFLYRFLRNLTKDEKNGDGEFYTYYDNGQLKKKANYVSGKLNGELLIYNENGNLTHKQNFKNGKFNGEVIEYDIKGEVKFRENYKHGKKLNN
jgi:hypothetical protein